MWEIMDGGLMTTVQDLGRFGYFSMGIPPAGAFDAFSLKVGNLLLKNELGEAGLEVLLAGLRMKALSELAIAVTGGDLTPTLNGRDVEMWRAIRVKKGDILHFSKIRSGCRAYVTVAGGIDVPPVLGSKSTYLRGRMGGYQGRALGKGDLVKIGDPRTSPSNLEGREATPRLKRSFGKSFEIRVVRGLEDSLFTPESVETFFSSEWRVSPKSDRMGVRFNGPQLSFNPRSQDMDHEAGSDPSNIVDSCIPTGGIQVPSGLELIVLAVDGPSTGGYAKIGTVISCDFSWIGQSKPGDVAIFREVRLKEAYHILKEEEKLFQEDGMVG